MAKQKTKVQPNVEIPEKGAKRSKYPLRELAVGDSFFVPCDNDYQHTVRSTVYSHAKRIGITVTLRRCYERNNEFPEGEWGLRIWRVDENTHNEDYQQVQPASADGAGSRE